MDPLTKIGTKIKEYWHKHDREILTMNQDMFKYHESSYHTSPRFE